VAHELLALARELELVASLSVLLREVPDLEARARVPVAVDVFYGEMA
jgi:hypothetical protein